MKTFVTSIIIVLIASFIIGCANQNTSSTKVVLLRDVTDNFNSVPSPADILKLFDFEEKAMWEEKSFSYSTLSNVSYNFSNEVLLPVRDKWLSNELTRKAEVAKFKTAVSSSITAMDTTTMDHSSVYLPIAKHLVILSQAKQQTRILIVYSDLMENRPEFSFYDKEKVKLLESSPDEIKKVLENWQIMPSLNGIEVYFIYQPKDVAADHAFLIVSTFYKNLLEQKGATVHIQANL